MAQATANDLIQFVSGSPTAVAAHDRLGWVTLFAKNGEINDPVGSSPHAGRTAIEKFYDTFIAPNTISFHVENDVVCGTSVFRDVTITTRMSTGVTLQVPMHLRYDVMNEGGQLKIRRLYAHWELLFMIIQLLRQGWKGVLTALQLGPQMLKHQGFGGMLGFMKGFITVGSGGKKSVEEFLAAVASGDGKKLERLIPATAHLELPVGRSVTLLEFMQAGRGLRYGKLLASGNTVTASIAQGDHRGVALFQFDGNKIVSIEVFVN